MKSFHHYHWGYRLCRCKPHVLRPRKQWIASPPHHRSPDFNMLSGKKCSLHSVGWGGNYLYHVVFLLEGYRFSHARSFENCPQSIWWTSVYTSWNSRRISCRARGKIVTVEVEVLNAPLDYILLVVWSWFYPMRVIASTIYRLVRFPH